MGIKKRKREEAPTTSLAEEVDTSKPTAIYMPSEGRRYTLSLALPGSIIANAQIPELQTRLAGTIARALAVFCVDEVVVFDDGQNTAGKEKFNAELYTGYSDPGYFLRHVLSYLECPPHMRKMLFAMHPDLKLAGTLPSLDMPHHLRRDQCCQYREGVTLVRDDNKKATKNKKRVNETHTQVWTGLEERVYVEEQIPSNSRVTVKFQAKAVGASREHSEEIEGEVVGPDAPREEAGYYWGYQVRAASSLSAVLTESPYEEGYDLTFGTSERGIPVEDLTLPSRPDGRQIPEFNHMLIVLGGLAGLEVAVKADQELRKMDVQTPEALFDFWVNLVPGQGSRTIRTEEAVWLALMGLKGIVKEKGIK